MNLRNEGTQAETQVQQQSKPAIGAQIEQIERAPTPTVCVIEDDAAIRDTLRFLLEEEGYQVIEAPDGMAGYKLLRESATPLIALVDHKLPKMDGCDLLQLAASDADLRARHEFIFVTASPKQAEDDCGETLDELNAPLIPKPFDIDELLEPVAEAAQRMSRRD